MSEQTTRGIRIRVSSLFIRERSDPDDGAYFFAYRVYISNNGTETVQLMSRHWVITDGDGEVQEVRGPGVVGEQPVIAPGETYDYTSACPLTTPVGTMHGAYQMVTESGEIFDATIAPFTLAVPNTLN